MLVLMFRNHAGMFRGQLKLIMLIYCRSHYFVNKRIGTEVGALMSISICPYMKCIHMGGVCIHVQSSYTTLLNVGELYNDSLILRPLTDFI